MTGQDAVNSAEAFNNALELDGVILTKLDGDARGGAAISVKEVTGVPIKFVGTGETLDAIEEFHPDRMASRILGGGDLQTLLEMAQQKIDREELAEQEERLKKGEFTLDDFRKQLGQASKLGPMSKVLSFFPGMGNLGKLMDDAPDAEDEMKRIRGIIDGMTPEEKRNPKVIDQSRRRRIAVGSGVEPHQVNELIKMFEPMANMMKQMATMGMRDRVKAVREMTQNLQANPNAVMQKQKKGTGKRLSPKQKAKLKKEREKEKRRKKREKKRKKS